MSCPDWSTLIARRDHDSEGELQWDRALPHLDACEACREKAYAAEPTLIFRRLPTVEPSSRQIDDMKQAVAALRRAQPIVEPSRTRPARKRFVTLRLAAAMAMVAGSGLLYAVLAPEIVPSTSSTISDLNPTALVEPAVAEPAVTEPTVAEQAVAATDGRLYIEIHVVKASKVDRGAPMFERSPSPELVKKLKEVVDYEVFEVMAQGDVMSSEGDEVATKLGRDYNASFKTGEMSATGTILLRDFEMEKISVNKSGQAPAKILFSSEFELSLENPLTVVVASGDANRPALILAITCRLGPIENAR